MHPFLAALLNLVFAIFAVGILGRAAYLMIKSFNKADLPHPFWTMVIVFVSGLAAYSIIGYPAVHHLNARDATVPFFSMMLASIAILFLFRLVIWLSNRRRWGSFVRKTAFLASAWSAMTVALVLNAMNAIPTIK